MNCVLSVIVPVYNGQSHILNCLSALNNARDELTEIIVVDDCSTDATNEICRRFPIKLLELDQRRGASFARNFGAANSTGELILFVDADVIAGPDIVRRVREIFVENSSAAAFFGSYDDAPAAANFVAQYKNLAHHYFHQTGRRDADTFWSGCGAIRREVFIAVGGFNEKQFCVEDIELGYRLRARGERILLIPELQVKHLKRWTFGTMLRADIFCRAIPWAKLLLLHEGVKHDLNLQFAQKASAVFVGLMIAALILSFRSAFFLVLVGLFALLTIGLNYRFYLFFLRRKGLWFTVWVFPMQLLYYIYSSAAFLMCWFDFKLRRAGKFDNPDF